MVSTVLPGAFAYSAIPRSALMSTGLQPGIELVPWRPNPALFALTRGGGQGIVSTSGLAVMTKIPAQSGVVNVVMLPPSNAGREEEIVAPVSPSGGALGSPARFMLEEDEGVALAFADLETEGRPLAEPEEAWAREGLGVRRSGAGGIARGEPGASDGPRLEAFCIYELAGW
jgi:hypothetical protein